MVVDVGIGVFVVLAGLGGGGGGGRCSSRFWGAAAAIVRVTAARVAIERHLRANIYAEISCGLYNVESTGPHR